MPNDPELEAAADQMMPLVLEVVRRRVREGIPLGEIVVFIEPDLSTDDRFTVIAQPCAWAARLLQQGDVPTALVSTAEWLAGPEPSGAVRVVHCDDHGALTGFLFPLTIEHLMTTEGGQA